MNGFWWLGKSSNKMEDCPASQARLLEGSDFPIEKVGSFCTRQTFQTQSPVQVIDGYDGYDIPINFGISRFNRTRKHSHDLDPSLSQWYQGRIFELIYRSILQESIGDHLICLTHMHGGFLPFNAGTAIQTPIVPWLQFPTGFQPFLWEEWLRMAGKSTVDLLVNDGPPRNDGFFILKPFQSEFSSSVPKPNFSPQH